MEHSQITFSGHAIRQMFRRGITKQAVLDVIGYGQVIIDYPDDIPYPSCLMLGFVNDEPIHIVFALDRESKTGIVITAYIPAPQLWSEDFKSRRDKR